MLEELRDRAADRAGSVSPEEFHELPALPWDCPGSPVV